MKISANTILDALPHPVLTLNREGRIMAANMAAESFFLTSDTMLKRLTLKELMPINSPTLDLFERVLTTGNTVKEYALEIGTPKHGRDRSVDLHFAPLEDGFILLMLQERGMAEMIERQLQSRSAARSVSGLAAMLAHEIKNPLAGIKGAAQLLESSVTDQDRALTQLIVLETDRIVKLVNELEVFSDERPILRDDVNIHAVLEQCKLSAQAGFARHIKFVEEYDPSLPPVQGDKDQLVQVFLNLIKNAAEAINGREDGVITLQTAFRPGVRVAVAGSQERLKLPLQVSVKDNGAGIPPDILPSLFDPFITTKQNGTGLGLALVAKLIRDHGGIAEVESIPRKTIFRILLPLSERLS
jgi:two-component system, NtrC family, nitrogen regulation sensor histidine kinase GlnL